MQANHIVPRISVASFLAVYDWICAPLKELISDENPLYKEVPLKDYIVQYRWKERDGGISTLIVSGCDFENENTLKLPCSFHMVIRDR